MLISIGLPRRDSAVCALQRHAINGCSVQRQFSQRKINLNAQLSGYISRLHQPRVIPPIRACTGARVCDSHAYAASMRRAQCGFIRRCPVEATRTSTVAFYGRKYHRRTSIIETSILVTSVLTLVKSQLKVLAGGIAEVLLRGHEYSHQLLCSPRHNSWVIIYRSYMVRREWRESLGARLVNSYCKDANICKNGQCRSLTSCSLMLQGNSTELAFGSIWLTARKNIL